MSIRTCACLKPDGVLCHSPALRGKEFCYFHLDPEKRRLKMAWVKLIRALQVSKARRRDQVRKNHKRKFVAASRSPLSPMK